MELYDSVLDGMNRIIDVHTSALLEEPDDDTPNTDYSSTTIKSPQTSFTHRPRAHLVNAPSTPVTSTKPQYSAAGNESYRVTPQSSLPEDPACRQLEMLIWQQYKTFEYDALLINAQLLIESPAATNHQRTIAYVLVGSALTIQGKPQKAAEAFANAIKIDPTIVPTETIFPSSTCELYQKTKRGMDKF